MRLLFTAVSTTKRVIESEEVKRKWKKCKGMFRDVEMAADG